MRAAMLGLLLVGSLGCATGIQGTYELYLRELPDGSKQAPPEIHGLATWTATARNFNVHWKDARGTDLSFSYMAKYELTATEYRETPLIGIEKRTARSPLRYIDGPTASSPVTRDGGTLRFQMPHSSEDPTLEFDGNGFKATAEGQFVDYWRRIK